MSQFRTPRKTSKYYVPGEVFLTTVHFCRQYPLWEAELAANPDTATGISYDRDRVQTSGGYDATAELAMHRQMIARKKELVDDTASEVAGPMDRWLILGVGSGLTFYQLQDRGIPCVKDMYYDLRRKFYYELSKKI